MHALSRTALPSSGRRRRGPRTASFRRHSSGRSAMPKPDAGSSRRILLVEDHPVERAYLQNMLLALGYRRVAGLGSSIEAVGAITRQYHDVLISDIVMGEGDG